MYVNYKVTLEGNTAAYVVATSMGDALSFCNKRGWPVKSIEVMGDVFVNWKGAEYGSTDMTISGVCAET